MKRFALLVSITAVLVGLAWLGGRVPRPAGAARPYEGQTIRAVVNAEYVKYSLSLIEKDLYDKLGVKIETEVDPRSTPSWRRRCSSSTRARARGTSSCSAPRTCRTTGGTSSRSSRGSRS